MPLAIRLWYTVISTGQVLGPQRATHRNTAYLQPPPHSSLWPFPGAHVAINNQPRTAVVLLAET